MTTTEIYNKIEAKKTSNKKTRNFLSLNPLSGIAKELRILVAKMELEITDLQTELDRRYEASN
jgi:hypothetical protein